MYKVGLLGATGLVGQSFLALLEHSKVFKVEKLFGRSINKKYKEVVKWSLSTPLPLSFSDILIEDFNKLDNFKNIDLVFSALPADTAKEIENKLRNNGKIVISNSSSYRLDNEVPLIVPEISQNYEALIKIQKEKYNGGFIATNPNCSVIGLSIGMYPVYKYFGLSDINLVTMQALSGAGLNGLSALDTASNLIPYIENEEEKIETEFKKIYDNNKINIKARVNRVSVHHGHSISVFFKTKIKTNINEIIDSYNKINLENNSFYKTINAPIYLIHDDKYSPQPLKHINYGSGFTTHIGRIKQYNDFEFSFNILSHNLIRGAAGGTILIANTLLDKNII